MKTTKPWTSREERRIAMTTKKPALKTAETRLSFSPMLHMTSEQPTETLVAWLATATGKTVPQARAMVDLIANTDCAWEVFEELVRRTGEMTSAPKPQTCSSCQVDTDPDEGYTVIELCPKHAAADAVIGALRALLADCEDRTDAADFEGHPAWVQARAAIALAEKGTA